MKGKELFSILREKVYLQTTHDDRSEQEEEEEGLNENENESEINDNVSYIPPNQLEELEIEDQIQEEQDTLRFLEQDPVDYDQIAQQYQIPEQNQEEETPPEVESLLEWRRQRRIFSMIPPTIFEKGIGTSVRAIRAHDSDLRLERPTVLFPVLYREQGVSLPMGYDFLEVDLVHVRPWTYHDLYGIKYEEETLFFPDSTQEIITYPLNQNLDQFIKNEITTILQEHDHLLLDKNWVRLDTALSVLSEEQGVSYIRVYSVLIQGETVQEMQAIKRFILEIQTRWEELTDQQQKDDVRNYMERVYNTQTLFFLVPLAMGIVPEARRSARTFLVFDPVSKEGQLDRMFKQTKGFYLPGVMTIATRLDGNPIQRDQWILGPKLSKDALLEFLTGENQELEDRLEQIHFDEGEFEQAANQVSIRRIVGDWANKPIIYEVESKREFWRDQMMGEMKKNLPQTFILTSTLSFTQKNQILDKENMIRDAIFHVERYFILERGIFTANLEFRFQQKIMFVCNSTTLILDGTLLSQDNPSPDNRAILFYSVFVIQVSTAYEGIIWSWGRERESELKVSVSKTKRHLSPGGRVYYGIGLGQYIVIDRDGSSQAVIIPNTVEKRLRDEAMDNNIEFGYIYLCLKTKTTDEYIVIGNQYRARVLRDRILFTRSMLISENIYLVRFIMGAIGTLNVSNNILPVYRQILETHYEDRHQFFKRNFRQPQQREQGLGRLPQSSRPFHF